MIPISKYVADKQTKELVNQVLESGQLSQGPMVERAEELIAEISGCKYAVCVANGTIALEAMLHTIPKTIIETSPLTFRATVKAIENAGHRAEFKDVNNETLCVGGDAPVKDDRFYMPVDLYGQHADVRGPWAYRDSAQGLGLDLSASKASAISFYTTKNVGAGEGGAVVTNDGNLAQKIRAWRNQGLYEEGNYKFATAEGYNWRWNELAAAVAIPQLENINEITAKRSANAGVYTQAFLGHPMIVPEFGGLLDEDTVWHQYTLRHPKRDEIVAILKYKGIGARVYYPELVSPKDQWEATPVALQASKEVFSIPVHQHLTEEERDYIVETVRDVVEKVSQ